MGKNRFPRAVCLRDDNLSQIQGHYQDTIPFDGTCKYLDAVGAVADLLAHSFCRLRVRFDFRDVDVVGLKKSLHVNWSSALRPERLAHRKNPRAAHFAA